MRLSDHVNNQVDALPARCRTRDLHEIFFLVICSVGRASREG